MICLNCNQYYPDDEKQCPWCNSVRSSGGGRGELKAVSAVLLRTEYDRSMFKGLVGYALLGVVGAIIGLRANKKATFSVTYQNGRTGTETVKVGSRRYRELIK